MRKRNRAVDGLESSVSSLQSSVFILSFSDFFLLIMLSLSSLFCFVVGFCEVAQNIIFVHDLSKAILK